jgi:glycosyltransferase involved in cell wall biosynthesis
MVWLFWLSLTGAAYSYCLYPVLLAVLVVVRGRRLRLEDDGVTPSVSLIVAAHNEAARIKTKIENCLEIDYPRLEIVVASDSSNDSTDAIVRQFADRGVILVRALERRGKEFAQQLAIQQARGDLLVFSDTATRVAPEAVRRIVRYFRDPAVGAVSSEDRFVREDGTLVGEGAYVRFEMLLRRLESSLAGLVGLSGSLFAARRRVCEMWDVHSPSDFNTAISCAMLRLRAVAAPDVIGYYGDLKDPSSEYRRKVRTVTRGMTGLFRHWQVMSPRRFGLFGWQVFSHKLMRWLVPVFLANLLVASIALQNDHVIYAAAFVGQVVLYSAGLLAFVFPVLHKAAVLRLVFFFCQVNVAIVHAALNFLAGKRTPVWQPSER